MSFRPLRAFKAPSLVALRYPLLASPKLDGIRAIVRNGITTTRSLKPIGNVYTRSLFSHIEYEGMDGELIIEGKTFSELSGELRRFDGEPDVQLHVFDCCRDPQSLYDERLASIKRTLKINPSPYIRLVTQISVHSPSEAEGYYKQMLAAGYEGIMLRSMSAPYKYGTATKDKQHLIKHKPITDSEATIIGFEELLINDNPAKINALGLTERKGGRELTRPGGRLGALIVRDVHHGWEFNIGSGWDHALSQKMWDNRDEFMGQLVKYKYQEEGMKDVPRFPVFIGFRMPEDMEP